MGKDRSRGFDSVFTLLAPNVVVVVAGEDLDLAASYFEDARRQLREEVAIVRDEDDGSLEMAERFEQYVFGAHVEVVRRLIEQQKVRRMDQQLGECVAVALSAGEHAQRFKNVIPGEPKRPEQPARLGLRQVRRGIGEVLKHAARRIEHLVLVLGEVVRLDVVSEAEAACGRRIQLGQQSDQRGFARAVHADQSDAISALDGEARIGEDLLLAV